MSRRPKGLSAEDRRLWTHVAAGVKPLDPSRRLVEAEAEAATPEPAVPAPARRRAVSPPAPPPPAVPQPPPLAAIEKGLKRKLVRGRREADARIDLHGLTQ